LYQRLETIALVYELRAYVTTNNLAQFVILNVTAELVAHDL